MVQWVRQEGNVSHHARRLVYVINSLEHGGAETMLCSLASRLDRRRYDLHVISLINSLALAAPLRDAGIPISCVGMRPGVYDPRGLFQLTQMLRRLRPALVQTWMDHSNLIGGLAAWCAGRMPVLWSIHHADHVRHVAKRMTLAAVWAGARLSRRLAGHTVFCSRHAATLYAARGYPADQASVIPNGFDTQKFRPDAPARLRVRRELGATDDTPLVGLAARYDPFKDHATFIDAARLISRQMPAARFVLCGAKIDSANAPLMAAIGAAGMESKFDLLGPRSDMPAMYAALDLLVSSSISEAFPLVLGEAMACGTPCVATDVGDSRLIVGDCGTVVPPRDPAALAQACVDALRQPDPARHRRGELARERIVNSFDLDHIARQYQELYDHLMDGCTAANGSAA